MKTSPAGRAAITRHEGNRLKAYRDSVGVLTIGVGHTSAAGPPTVTDGMRITAAESDAILSRDLVTFERAVERAIKAPMSQNQFDAMVSLAFNIGGGAFAKSSIARRFNAGDTQGAADAFLLYNKAGGQVLKGLTTRRKAERAQFLSNGPTAAPVASKAIPSLPDLTSYEVRAAQQQLADLGYTMVGKVDGKPGPRTSAATAAFQKVNDLPVTGFIDAATRAALGGDPVKMPIDLDRLATTAKDLKPVSGIIRKSIRQQLVAAATAVVPGVGGIMAFAGQAVDFLRPIRDFLDSVPGWVWLCGVIGVAAFMWWQARGVEQDRVEMSRQGLTA